jgi:hypothetical protein
VKDFTRKIKSAYLNVEDYHPDKFLTEEEALKGWEFHKRQMKLEFPKGGRLGMCNEAKMIITEIKELKS